MSTTLRRRPVRQLAAACFLRLLVVAAALSVLFVPALSVLAKRSTPDPSSITSYRVGMELSKDGRLRTLEQIDVDTGFDRRGIFRIFDTAPRSGTGPEHPVSEVSVTRDGLVEPAEFVPSAKGTASLRIGDPNVILTPGPHRYVIGSTTVDALERGPDDTVVWWWNVVGSGWQMTMDQVEVEVALPAAPSKVECVQGRRTACPTTVDGTRLRLSTGPLKAYTPVTLRVTFPPGALPAPPGPAPSGSSSTWLLAVLLGALGTGIAVALWRATRERPPGMPVLFEPPEGVSPALGVRILDEAGGPDDLQATLFHLAERGVLQLTQNDNRTWTVARVGEPETGTVEPAEAAVLRTLGIETVGEHFTVSRTTTSGEKIAKANTALGHALDADQSGYLTRSRAGSAARAVGWIATGGVLAMAGVYHFGGSAARNVPLLVGAAVLSVGLLGVIMDPRTRTVHSEQGRELWTRVGGFARFLSTDSSESRFDAAAHVDWFPRYLPWALALGVGEEWARRYEAQGVSLDSATVPYVYWGTGGVHSWHDMSLSDSFNAAVGAASASYAASQATSGGGGGFSGGSGGGGGGGGSW
ncbi:MAG: DUF2207 domain-containing protein [Actinomycetes bacterium]